ncbi:MAG: HD-GYP domain-containing protein [bacterium]
MKQYFPVGQKVYLALVIAGGIAVLYFTFPYWQTASIVNFLIFGIISYLANVLLVPLPKFKAYLSVASHMNFAALFLFGPFALWIPALTGALPDSLPLKKPYVYLFNGGQLALSYGLAALTYYKSGGVALAVSLVSPASTILPALFSGLVFSLVNTGLNAGVISFDEGNFFKVFKSLLRWELPNILIAAPFALFLAYIFVQLGYLGLAILFLPMLASRYIFQAYIRIQETHSETIQALMTTVDKKFGQPGRNQKVYQYALQVSQNLGLSPEEAEILGYASYLRHIGLIGIENNTLELALSQPIWSSSPIIVNALLAGSQILEHTETLEKAAPFIRLHHERWDGSGPWGLKGEQIPLGARIISACEFVEELESRKESQEEILRSLKEKSGKHFDPRIVQALITILENSKNEEERS